MKVFIPSKKRPETIRTPSGFTDANLPTIVIEPQEESAYRKAGWKNLLVLPKNDQGIVYVRNFILEHSIRDGFQSYWMLDDDISSFMYYTGSKAQKCSAEEALSLAEKTMSWNVPNLAQGALEYSQFAWSQKKPIVVAGYCDVAVLMFPKKIGTIRYRGFTNPDGSPDFTKEDRDFTLQILSAGMLTARAAKVAFACPKNGSNEGGMHSLYAQQGREKACSERMVKTWPGICTMKVKKDGRPDVKIDWKRAAGLKKS